jgi:hypothetical protein
MPEKKPDPAVERIKKDYRDAGLEPPPMYLPTPSGNETDDWAQSTPQRRTEEPLGSPRPPDRGGPSNPLYPDSK